MELQPDQAKENPTPQEESNQHHPHPTGLDQWNDRLDENLENENQGNVTADENAEKYSAEKGSGDQSDPDV